MGFNVGENCCFLLFVIVAQLRYIVGKTLVEIGSGIVIWKGEVRNGLR